VVIKDDSIFYAWFERHGCLLNQIVDFARAVRDDSVVSTNSRDMDASRSGPIRDDSVVYYQFEKHGCFSKRGYQG
jgi:hypothetical protein